MLKVNTHEAKTRLSALLATVESSDERVVICRNGRPIAELRGWTSVQDPLRVHPHLSNIEFCEDPVAPLEPEDWPEVDEGPSL